ncbi:MAG: complex I NDUFA9 subunit family protein, partial [gamma proteobacterium symbiont of Ctena orbiculata]
ANTLGRNKLMLPVPVFAPATAAAVFDRFPCVPISRD